MQYPIDIVYTWVDGEDPNHISYRRHYIPHSSVIKSSDAVQPRRFRSCGEIYQSIQSVIMFAPFIRYIFIVIDDLQIDRFNNIFGERVKTVKHSDIYQDYITHLPVFNSHSIESHLWQIPGLSECFLYANDDTFFGKPVDPSIFFDTDGTPHVFPSRDLVLRKIPSLQMAESWAASRINNTKLLDHLAGRKYDRHEWIHQIRPIRKSYFADGWNHPLIHIHLERTSKNRFRCTTDIEPVGFLLHWKTDMNQTYSSRITSHTFIVEDRTNLKDLFTRINQGYTLYCINDGFNIPSISQIENYKLLLSTFLPHHRIGLPIPKIIEKPVVQTVDGYFSTDRVASMGHIRK